MTCDFSDLDLIIPNFTCTTYYASSVHASQGYVSKIDRGKQHEHVDKGPGRQDTARTIIGEWRNGSVFYSSFSKRHFFQTDHYISFLVFSSNLFTKADKLPVCVDNSINLTCR